VGFDYKSRILGVVKIFITIYKPFKRPLDAWVTRHFPYKRPPEIYVGRHYPYVTVSGT